MIATWYAITAFMLIVYVVLDGRNFGVGMLHWAAARTPAHRPKLRGCCQKMPSQAYALHVAISQGIPTKAPLIWPQHTHVTFEHLDDQIRHKNGRG